MNKLNVLHTFASFCFVRHRSSSVHRGCCKYHFGLQKEDQTRMLGSAKPLFVKNSIMEHLKKYLVNIL